jgi:hypothetical protein
MQDKRKGSPARAGGPWYAANQNGASLDSAPASALIACVGTSASARLGLRTEFARTAAPSTLA